MQSIRRQILSRLLAGASLLLLIAGLALGLAIHSRLVAELDHTLETKARALAVLTSIEDRFIEFDFSPGQMPEFDAADELEYFELRLPDGRLLAKSPSLGEGELPATGSHDLGSTFRNIVLPDGGRGRLARLLVPMRTEEPDHEPPEADAENEDLVFIAEFDDQAPSDLAITVARSRADLDALLLGLYGTLIAIGLLLLCSLTLLTQHTVRRGLQPIADISTQVGAIRPEALENRIHPAALPEELRTIVTAINALLERLQQAFEKERRFSSDVAHELRTPVAELRAACEVGGRWPENPADTGQFFDDVRDIATHMEHVVSNMLTLARCDAGTETIAVENVVLEPLIRSCAERAFMVVGDVKLPVEFSLAAGAAVDTDRARLQMILQNLFDNAATYRVPNTLVHCSIEAHVSTIELRIENRVDSLTRQDVAHVTDRFWRKDEARTGGTHAGLGLSIARALSEKLGFQLHLELRDETTFGARLVFAARG